MSLLWARKRKAVGLRSFRPCLAGKRGRPSIARYPVILAMSCLIQAHVGA